MADQARQNKETALVEFDNSVDLRQDLPSRFSLLEDSNFPLFISFDKLCSLLEGDLPPRTHKVAGRESRRKVIGYDEFREQYWSRLNKELTPLVNPVLVYSEIVGIIKGSSAARESECGYLSRVQYTEQLCYRVLSQLTTATREIIYSLFEQYRWLKAERFELDWADRTCYILDHLDEQRIDQQVDYLYVDEVQDNLMLDVHLLRELCDQIRGTYWGGDTAQTIVAGSAFRIKELKSFVYCDIQNNQLPFASVSPSSLFTTFKLTTNFRSHTGIVNCAASIVESIYRLFPNSIDRMPPETARVWGPPPVLFTDSNDDISFFKGFVLGSNPSSQVGFGAQQAILVRSDALAEELELKLHGLCPVISIVNCKGLEFDDVLIYNFFTQSAASFEDWQFVTGLPEHKRKREHELVVPPALCLELKLLYVAITRARKRCWIWDSGETYDAMKSYLLDRELVSITSATRMLGRIGVSSTQTQWAEKGREYFSHSMYKYASACFNHAGREKDANIASAYHQMSRAKLDLLRRDNGSTRAALVEAAQSLKGCIIGPSDQNAKHLWFHAGSCLELARQFASAADAFVEGGFPAQAIGVLFGNQVYDRGSELLLDYWDQLEPCAREPLLDRSRHYFFGTSDYELLSRVFWGDVGAQLAFARANEYIPQLKGLLKTHERFDELSELYLGEKNFPSSVEYSLEAFKTYHLVKSVERAAQITIDYARTIVLLDGRYREIPRRTLTGLVAMVLPYLSELGQESRKWLKFLHALVTKTHITLDDAKLWNSEAPSEKGPMILGLHFALMDMGWLYTDSLSLVIRHLHAWSVYASNILQIAQDKEPSSSVLTQALLGLRNPDLGSRALTYIRVFEDSLVFEAARRDGAGITRNNAGEFLLPTKIADNILESEVTARLCDRVHTLVSFLLDSRWTISPFPIINSPIYNSEHQPGANEALPEPKFKMRLNVVAYAMRSLTSVRHLVQRGERYSVGQLWIHRLHDTIYPLNGMEENVSLISSLPDQASLVEEILTQVRAELTRLDPKVSRPAEFLTSLIRNLALTRLLGREMLDQYHSQKNVSFKHFTDFTRRCACSARAQSLGADLLQFFRGFFPESLSRGIYALQHILDSDMGMDATVLVHLSELITRELIFSSRAATSTTQDGFAGIILPFSWARSLAKTWGSSRKMQHPWPLDTFLQSLHRLASEIKFGVPGRWTVGEAWLSGQ
ncbi:hypothetical protein FRC08_015211 [Ceratobasidium sp. 394]|nr:hypothetical protein FRC08_015211 [Ceratobasidium sp. 394]